MGANSELLPVCHDAFGAFWSAAGGAHWPLATYCPSREPSPFAAQWHLTPVGEKIEWGRTVPQYWAIPSDCCVRWCSGGAHTTACDHSKAQYKKTASLAHVLAEPHDQVGHRRWGAYGALWWRQKQSWSVMQGGGGWHKASVSICLPLAAPIGLSPLLILNVFWLCQRSPRMTYSGGRPSRRRAVARAVDQVHPDAHSESMRGFADSSTDLSALGCASAG